MVLASDASSLGLLGTEEGGAAAELTMAGGSEPATLLPGGRKADMSRWKLRSSR